MSASLLRDRARFDIENLIADHKHMLVNRDDPPEAMNKTRGIVQGLQMALDSLNRCYSDLNASPTGVQKVA